KTLMVKTESDAFVFFGATGDLAYKKIFPALYAMVRRGGFHIPIIGMARAGWNLEQLKARARDSAEPNGDFDEASLARLAALRLFFFQAEDGIRDGRVTGVQTCA